VTYIVNHEGCSRGSPKDDVLLWEALTVPRYLVEHIEIREWPPEC
jgi:hypothetical protein